MKKTLKFYVFKYVPFLKMSRMKNFKYKSYN